MRRRSLGVNMDHVATLRQARKTRYPDPVTAAAMVEQAGADHITVHLREDRRHIQDRDVHLLRQTVQTSLNLEMAATPEMLKIAHGIKPHQITLVPEKRQELTTEGGLAIDQNQDYLHDYIQTLIRAGMHVSVFIDPEPHLISCAHRLGVTGIELHTGFYCEAHADSEHQIELQRLIHAARAAHALGLRVAAGHGLNYHNIQALVQVDDIVEYNIGHSIVAHAVCVGLAQAVRDMLALLTVS